MARPRRVEAILLAGAARVGISACGSARYAISVLTLAGASGCWLGGGGDDEALPTAMGPSCPYGYPDYGYGSPEYDGGAGPVLVGVSNTCFQCLDTSDDGGSLGNGPLGSLSGALGYPSSADVNEF